MRATLGSTRHSSREGSVSSWSSSSKEREEEGEEAATRIWARGGRRRESRRRGGAGSPPGARGGARGPGALAWAWEAARVEGAGVSMIEKGGMGERERAGAQFTAPLLCFPPHAQRLPPHARLTGPRI